MTRYSNHYSGKQSRSDHYNVPCVDDGDEYDEEFDDEDELDGLSDEFDDDDDLHERQSTSRESGRFNERISGQNGVFRRHRSLSDCASNSLEHDDNRRDHHNQLERKRRASIKTSYNDLREAIPSLRGSKASRAVILQRAVECIQELVRLNRDHTHCVETLRRQNDLLDARVQELQRFVQRLDDESPMPPTSSLSFSTSTANGSLRLCPTSSHSGPGTSGLPVYRLLPADSADRPITAISRGQFSSTSRSTVIPIHRSSVPISRGRVTTLTTVQPTSGPSSSQGDFTGINALSAAACLLSSGHSAFSSSSPSSGSNCEPAQSSSQRSSPGCLSSSLSNSSVHSGANSRTDLCEEPALRLDVPSGTNDSDCTDAVPNSSLNASSTLVESPTAGSNSPPSILLTVPVRSNVITAPSTDSVSTACSTQNAQFVTDSEDTVVKRRRVT